MTEKKIDKPDHRPEQRQGDVPEALKRARAVHLGRLEQRLVDALQAGDVEHHVEAEIFPQDDDQHRAERPGLVGEQDSRAARPSAPVIDADEVRSSPSNMKCQIRPAATSART